MRNVSSSVFNNVNPPSEPVSPQHDNRQSSSLSVSRPTPPPPQRGVSNAYRRLATQASATPEAGLRESLLRTHSSDALASASADTNADPFDRIDKLGNFANQPRTRIEALEALAHELAGYPDSKSETIKITEGAARTAMGLANRIFSTYSFGMSNVVFDSEKADRMARVPFMTPRERAFDNLMNALTPKLSPNAQLSRQTSDMQHALRQALYNDRTPRTQELARRVHQVKVWQNLLRDVKLYDADMRNKIVQKFLSNFWDLTTATRPNSDISEREEVVQGFGTATFHALARALPKCPQLIQDSGLNLLGLVSTAMSTDQRNEFQQLAQAELLQPEPFRTSEEQKQHAVTFGLLMGKLSQSDELRTQLMNRETWR